jgi:hypothetical protein
MMVLDFPLMKGIQQALFMRTRKCEDNLLAFLRKQNYITH